MPATFSILTVNKEFLIEKSSGQFEIWAVIGVEFDL